MVPKEFTHDYYRYFLEQLLKKFKFIDFEEGKRLSQKISDINNGISYTILRHDIDMDLNAAFLLSNIEKEFGVSSTYFIMLRCPIYNAFDAQNSEYIKQLVENGHHIGLHFDCAVYNDITATNIESFIDKECDLIKSFFDRTVESISFHRPGPLALNNVVLQKYTNTYEKVYLDYFNYFSDSRSRWVRGNPLDSDEYKNNRNLHLLIHPIWWNQEFIQPYERLIGVVNNIKNNTESYLSYNCSVWNEGKIKK